MKIDISNYRLYSSEELRSYAEKGLLTFQGADNQLINECILYMLEGLYTEGDMEKAKEEAYEEGRKEGMTSYDRREIERVISILEDLV